MRIRGYFDTSFTPKAPALNVTLHIKALGIKRKIDFLMDTGASVTLLLDKDVIALGIDVKVLGKSKLNI